MNDPEGAVSLYKRRGALNSGIISTSLDGTVANFANIAEAWELAFTVLIPQFIREHVGAVSDRVTTIQSDDTLFVIHPEAAGLSGEALVAMVVAQSMYDADVEHGSIFLKMARFMTHEVRIPARFFDGLFPERASYGRLTAMGGLIRDGSDGYFDGRNAAGVAMIVRLNAQLETFRAWDGAGELLLEAFCSALPRDVADAIPRDPVTLAIEFAIASKGLSRILDGKAAKLSPALRASIEEYLRSNEKYYGDNADEAGLTLGTRASIASLIALVGSSFEGFTYMRQYHDLQAMTDVVFNNIWQGQPTAARQRSY
jgi:hypothetical protein